MTDAECPNASEDGRPTDRLAGLLIRHGVVSVAQIQAAQALQGDLTKALIDLGFLSEERLTEFLGEEVKIPRLSLHGYQIDPETVRLVPRELCLRYRLLPIDLLGAHLTLAMVNPLNDEALHRVQEACSEYKIKPFLCTPADFESIADTFLKEEEEEDGSPKGGMSLNSLGLKAAATKEATPSPEPASAPDDTGDDAQATMLFDSKGTPSPPRSTGPMRSSLICLDGWELGREVEIVGESHTLGRSPDADTTLNSPLISRVHAKITRNAEFGQETFVVTDLKSSNGTFVNNIPVTSTILRHGDRILVGAILFKFVLLDEVEARFHKDVHRLYSIHKDTGLLPAEAWRKELTRALASGESSTACMIEIDGLKTIREAHGQIAVVIVLNDISDILGRHLETNDLPSDYGAGRMAILFEGRPIEAVFPILEDLRRTIEAHTFNHQESHFRCTISVGVGTASSEDGTPEALIAKIETALDSAISSGMNQTAVAQ
jgi:two-component system, cell cycle response regulator